MKVGSRNKLYTDTPRVLIILLAAILLSGGFSIIGNIYAQKRQEKKVETESFSRPKPKQPIKPEVPKVNRYQQNKVFLEKADSLFRPPFDFDDKQVVKGGVVFRQGGMWMMCDSAYYYPERNSLNAFGHVEMKQGDTLFVYADKLFYNGSDRKAYLTSGPSRKDVKLKNRKVTLTCDSLDYDLNLELGWYSTGGKLTDDMNSLTSIYGEYSPATKLAKFMQDVLLVNNKDGYRMTTEELLYNTATHIATISTETLIEGRNDTIITSAGTYNTQTDYAVLTARSKILHRDSARNVVTLEGDSLVYDKVQRVSRAYMFKSGSKLGRPVVMTDTAHKVVVYGGFAEYNDSTQRGFSTDYPLLVEYSRADTLFLRADTILTSVRVENVWPDSLSHNWSQATRDRLRMYTSLQQIADSLILKLALLPNSHIMPGAEGKLLGFKAGFFEKLKKQSGGEGNAPAPDSGAAPGDDDESGIVPEISTGASPDEEKPVRRKGSRPAPSPATRPSSPAASNPADKQGGSPADSARVPLRRLDKLGRDSLMMVPKDFYTASAIGRARFFKQDLQGVADTINYQQYDSMLYLIRKPIVWSGESQIFGGRIHVHLLDSTADRAYLPERGFLAEHIEEDFYNQLSGRQITAFFENGQVRNVQVNGNVETIFLPQENDSTYNRMIQAESSFLTIDMGDRKLEKIKMWPEVSGTVTPLFMVKKNQQYLPGFRWYEYLRPRREWYGERYKWIDELGEVPEDLDKYFKEEDERYNKTAP